MSQEILIRRVESAEGKRYAELRERWGFFIFEEYAEDGDGEHTFMAPSHGSGLYGTKEEAERDMVGCCIRLRS
jgi:hypothetical protein